MVFYIGLYFLPFFMMCITNMGFSRFGHKLLPLSQLADFSTFSEGELRLPDLSLGESVVCVLLIVEEYLGLAPEPSGHQLVHVDVLLAFCCCCCVDDGDVDIGTTGGGLAL